MIEEGKEEERPLGESSDDIFDEVTGIMENTAFLVNQIREGIRLNLSHAVELEELAEQFREIARNQQEMVLRLAEIGSRALRSEFISSGDDGEEVEEEIDCG